MTDNPIRIGVVAPSRPLDAGLAKGVQAIAEERFAGRIELRVHEQCFATNGHFAGTDEERAAAFLEFANDEALDVVWFARGGYGACRLLDRVAPELTGVALSKTYLGYSDAGFLLGALYAAGAKDVVHAPMPVDLSREGGEVAIRRTLSWLVDRDASASEPSIREGKSYAAFNLNILSHLAGTPYMPDLSDHVVMVEEVSEYLYQIDRSFFQIVNCPQIASAAGLKLGRCNDVPENDVEFGCDEEDVARRWCERAGIAYLGRADIGHDADNRIVPFGPAART